MRRTRFSNRRNTGKGSGKRVNKRSSYKRKMTNKRKGSYKRRSQKGGSFTHFSTGGGAVYTGDQAWQEKRAHQSPATKQSKTEKHMEHKGRKAKARKANKEERQRKALQAKNTGNSKRSRWPMRE